MSNVYLNFIFSVLMRYAVNRQSEQDQTTVLVHVNNHAVMFSTEIPPDSINNYFDCLSFLF